MSCCKVLFSFQAQRCWTWRVQAMMYDLITEHDLLFATQHFLVPELVHLATCIYFSCARFLLYEWVSVEACQAVSRWLEIVFQKKNQSLVDSVSTWQGETISNKSLQPCWALIFILFCFVLFFACLFFVCWNTEYSEPHMSTDMVVSKGPQVESPKSVLDVYKRTHSIYTQFSLVMWVVFFHPVSSFFFKHCFGLTKIQTTGI